MTDMLGRYRCLRTIFILCVILMFSVLLLAQAPPSQDTFVSSTTPKINYGPAISLLVGPGTTSYIQFNLSGIPAGATVSKASLRLYVDAVAAKGSFDVYAVTGGWSENTLTYSSPPPARGASVTGGNPVSITSASMNQFLLIDITALAQGWVNGTVPNNGLELSLTSAAGTFSFDSKESLLTGNGPELEIALAGSAGPQGPVGPQGLQGLQGVQGPMGLTGAQGPQGDPGPAGFAGKDGIGFNFRNAFDNGASYAANDVVTYNGSSYVASAANQGPNNPAPDQNSAWALMAQKGAAGPAGAAGATGSAGATGAAGPQGPAGTAGVSVTTFSEPAGSNCAAGGVKLVAINATTYVCNGSSAGTTFFTISGTLSGLATGTTVTLLDNASDQVTLAANGAFTFPTPLATGASYTVTVLSEPTGGTCTITNGSGTVGQSSNVTGIVVTCTVPIFVTTVASGQDHPSAILVDGTNVYWNDAPPAFSTAMGIRSLPLAGGSISVPWSAEAISFAMDLNSLYLISTGDLYQVPKTGMTETTIASSSFFGTSPFSEFAPAFGLAVDAQNAYVGDGVRGIIWKVVLQPNGAVSTFAALPPSTEPYAIVMDDTNVYWTETGSAGSSLGRVMRLAKTGGTPTVIASGLDFPAGLAVDSTNVYWTDNIAGTVMMAPKVGGTTPTVVASAQTFPFGIYVDSQNIYWTNQGTSTGGTVMKVPIAGGTPMVIASGQNFPFGITGDQAHIYWTNNGGPNAPTGSGATGTVMKASK